MDLIRLKNITKKYKNGVTAIYDLSLAIEKGSFTFVIGGSGSGKSTLIKMLYREEKPTRGQIILGGLNVAKLRDGKVYKLRRKLGIVFQDYRLLEKQTVYENVAFALEVIGAPNSEIRPKVLTALEEPVKQIARNAGLEPAVIVDKVKSSKVGTGFDAVSRFCEIAKEGIPEATKVDCLWENNYLVTISGKNLALFLEKHYLLILIY